MHTLARTREHHASSPPSSCCCCQLREALARAQRENADLAGRLMELAFYAPPDADGGRALGTPLQAPAACGGGGTPGVQPSPARRGGLPLAQDEEFMRRIAEHEARVRRRCVVCSLVNSTRACHPIPLPLAPPFPQAAEEALALRRATPTSPERAAAQPGVLGDANGGGAAMAVAAKARVAAGAAGASDTFTAQVDSSAR